MVHSPRNAHNNTSKAHSFDGVCYTRIVDFLAKALANKVDHVFADCNWVVEDELSQSLLPRQCAYIRPLRRGWVPHAPLVLVEGDDRESWIPWELWPYHKS